MLITTIIHNLKDFRGVKHGRLLRPQSLILQGFEIGAPGEGRTPTSFRTTDFESAASASSATGACDGRIIAIAFSASIRI